MKYQPTRLLVCLTSLMLCFSSATASLKMDPSVSAEETAEVIEWEHLSSLYRQLPFAEVGSQVSTLVFDVDMDGLNDFVIAGWGEPSMVWFKRTDSGWEKYLIDAKTEFIEAGGAFADIDGDGDLDIVQGGDWRTLKEVWWWENPAPHFDKDTPWKRYHVKNSDEGGKQHHDQMFGDFDGDGQLELVFWNTSVRKLFIAEIPEDPKSAPTWDLHLIHQFDEEGGVLEGLAKGDVDGDGILDIVGGGFWLKHKQGHEFEVFPVDPNYRATRSAVGDLIEGGWPEIILSSGDNAGTLNIYEYQEGEWKKTVLLDPVMNGHTLELVDINGDGHLDIFTAEMAAWWIYQREDARAWVLYGDGKGNFTKQVISEGICHHESTIADLDGDGDLDILGKPFFIHGAPLEIWLNKGTTTLAESKITYNTIPPIFQPRKIDGPTDNWFGAFAESSAVFDVNNDGVLDIVAGPNWYEGPDYKKHANFRDIQPNGEFMNNGCDHAYDVNGDGWTDVISNGWFDDQSVYWYQNPGEAGGTWEKHLIVESKGTEFTFFEDLDGDGDPDLIPTHWEDTELFWVENTDDGFVKHIIGEHGLSHGLGFGDLNGDGRKDIAMTTGWYEAPEDRTQPWIWHPAFESARIQMASMPMIIHDVNADGRNDIIYGEAHSYGLFWLEQMPDASFVRHTIDLSWSQVHVLKLFDIDEDMKLELVTGKRLRGHAGADPGASDPLGIYYYELDPEKLDFERKTLIYNAGIGTGMQINIVDINKDTDSDIIVSVKSGLYLIESKKY